jgi:hypothetical protein
MWALADGASIYPSEIFRAGLRYVEDFPFGASYLEFGSRLRWLGFRIRHLDTTYVAHLFGDTRSHDDDHIERASRIFAMLCHSLVYQSTAANQALSFGQLVKELVAEPGRTIPALRHGRSVYRRHRADLESQRTAAQEVQRALESAYTAASPA